MPLMILLYEIFVPWCLCGKLILHKCHEGTKTQSIHQAYESILLIYIYYIDPTLLNTKILSMFIPDPLR